MKTTARQLIEAVASNPTARGQANALGVTIRHLRKVRNQRLISRVETAPGVVVVVRGTP